MKIKDLPYERAEYEKTEKYLLEKIEEIRNAPTVEDVLKGKDEFIREYMDFQSMASLANIRFTQNTKDKFYIEERKYYDEKFPMLSDIYVKYIDVILKSPHLDELKKRLPAKYFTYYEFIKKSNDPRVIEDRQKEAAVVTEYSELMGSMEFEYDGKKMPLSVLRGYFMDADRNVRKTAMEAMGRGLEKNRDKLDDIYDRLVKIRHTIARKMGYDNYTQVSLYEMGRFDYDFKDLDGFKAGVRKYLVPLMKKLKAQTAEELGIKDFKFYDNDVSLSGGEARPFADKEGIFKAAMEMYTEMDPTLARFMKKMQEDEAFDVEARDAKFGGGYCTDINKFNAVFILANFNGSSADIDVMTHEFGHAVAANFVYEKGFADLGLGMETAECHSMSMEFLAWRYMDKFFKEPDKYRYKHLYEALCFIPYGVIIDEFQRRVYENPDMTPAQRNAMYLELEKEYRPYLSFDGIPYLCEGTRWQYQMHVYESPFYYIDYCLAQTVALEFLMKSLEDYDGTLKAYLDFAAKGGTEYFRELVRKAGLDSPFDEKSFGKLVDGVSGVLKSIKERIK